MPPRDFIKPREKREELKTYRELALRRDMKSKVQRRKAEAGGKRRVLGDGSSTQPYLLVETARYREVRLDIQKQLLLEARKGAVAMPVDALLRQLKPRIEALTYAQLSSENAQDSLKHIPVASLGRALTADERKHFAACQPDTVKPNQGTQTALNRVLGSIEDRQSHNPARYQTIWAQLVGGDAAQQTEFVQVDAATQIAWFRCTNSVLSSDLQRRRGLPQKLAKALGVPVRQLRARF